MPKEGLSIDDDWVYFWDDNFITVQVSRKIPELQGLGLRELGPRAEEFLREYKLPTWEERQKGRLKSPL